MRLSAIVSNGPLPTTSAKNQDSAHHWDNIRRLFSDHQRPETRHTACVQQGMSNTTPLHLLYQSKPVPFDIIETVIECANEVVSWEDVNGWLPLHYACAKGASIDVIKALLQIYPEGSRIRDQRLRTPLHFVFYKGSLDGGDTNAGGTEKNSEMFFDSQGSNETDYEREAVVSLRDAVKIADEKNRLPPQLMVAVLQL